ncbi:Maf family protein [Dyella psychrodurans]|uniref:7-methyl-GTP pyrophosphatase n=1 Tax=Dyella psychrodurans TaxID=1927960 RepID=A0A370XE56_9GAMM|nr:nucleoside triphosphate pyrophosphatase [Dyella psychrodurans]RDS86525.1 septum formation protein Maf [Dyella psychrodurans]
MTTPSLVLGSTSRYRAELLRRLGLNFESKAPGTEEEVIAGETPAARAMRLAITKATDAGKGLGDALVIGSDQVAELDGVLLEKPGTIERAHAQLAACSGRSVRFHTALCVLDTRRGQRHTHLDLTQVHFRTLHATEISRYIEREQPLDCAGSFKCEGLGISLFDRIENSDPTALIGLPLIALARLLRDAGMEIP